MAKVELYINDSLCDLTGGESIDVDYTIFDITKIDTRGGARSYTFNLPKTNRNKTVLESAEMVNNLSLLPYTRMKARVYVDGIDMLIRFCEISSVKGSYVVNLYGANSSLFEGLKDLTLQQLDMSELDHYWNYANVLAGIYRTSGYGYGIIDYHADSPNSYITNDAIFADFMLPFVYVNYILEKIFEGGEYTFINSIASDTENLIVPAFKQCESNFFAPTKYEGTFAQSTPTVRDPGSSVTVVIINANSIVTYAGNYYTVPQPLTILGLSGNGFIIQDAVNMKFTFTLSITNNETVNVNFFLYKTEAFVGNGTSFAVIPGTHDYTVVLDYSSSAGDELLFNISSFTTADVIVETATIEISDVVIQELQLLIYGQYISLPAILPDITQIEFLKNYMQMFCLLPVVNEQLKTVTLVKFDSILDNIGNAYDWSDKIDWSEDYELKFIENNYGQNNYFKYTQDGDEPKPIGTDGNIQISNGNLEFEKEAVELIYAATTSKLRLYDNQIAQIGIFEEGEYTNEKEPRILNVRRGFNSSGKQLVDTLFNYTVVSGAVNIPYFIDAQQSFNLGFENNLLPNYYDLLTNVLSRVKILRLSVRLNAVDVANLDFTKPVWIKKFESYFYISSIKGFTYTESKSTLVELVKINLNG